MPSLTVHTDGGARGNPGPAACAAVFLDPSQIAINSVVRFLGRSTNNEAEYQAVILALETILANPQSYRRYDLLDFFLDSELVVNQLTGRYKIKHPKLQQLASTIHQLSRQTDKQLRFTHVKRHLNTLPDQLLNQELDLH